jgi:hypothetical protein
VSDLLPVDHVTIRLTCTIEHVTTQVETASGEVVLSLLPAVNILLPEQQLFQARAALYAQHEGEFSPIEEENLELLRNQLQLDEETAEQIKIRALGPYQDRQTKLERYRALLSHELDRQMPLSAHTQTELARFCEAIGLAANDEAIATISIEEIAKRQSSEDVTDSESEESDDRPLASPNHPRPNNCWRCSNSEQKRIDKNLPGRSPVRLTPANLTGAASNKPAETGSWIGKLCARSNVKPPMSGTAPLIQPWAWTTRASGNCCGSTIGKPLIKKPSVYSYPL